VIELSLLSTTINMMPIVLCQVIKLLSVLIYKTQQSCGAQCPLTCGDHRIQHRTHPMPRGDQLVVRWYMMPTRPLLDLSAALQHTESFGTLSGVTDQNLIRWCEANHMHQEGPLP
jgi:hypothetical protein